MVEHTGAEVEHTGAEVEHFDVQVHDTDLRLQDMDERVMSTRRRVRDPGTRERLDQEREVDEGGDEQITGRVEADGRRRERKGCVPLADRPCATYNRVSPMSLAPGETVDRYEVLELLGIGGMGEVYRARDSKLEREVALKIVRFDRSFGTDGSARLLREARAAAALSHPNVLAIYDVGEVQAPEHLRGLAYIAMELVVGKTLRAFIGSDALSIERRVVKVLDFGIARRVISAIDRMASTAGQSVPVAGETPDPVRTDVARATSQTVHTGAPRLEWDSTRGVG